MTAAAVPVQRAQVVPCETCGAKLPGLLADCTNALCLAASIDYLVRQDRQIEASDD